MESVAKQNAVYAKAELAKLEAKFKADFGEPFVLNEGERLSDGVLANWVKIVQPTGGFHIEFLRGQGGPMAGIIAGEARELSGILASGL